MCFIILYERAYNRHFILVLFTVPNMGSKNIFGAHCGLNMFADIYSILSPPRGHRGAGGGAPHQRPLRGQVRQDHDLLLAKLRPQHHAECGQGLR